MNESECSSKRTYVKNSEKESRTVWKQLLRQAEDGDLKAIKLYYEMLEKKQRKNTSSETEKIEQMAQIRRAVFGDSMSADCGQDGSDREDSS